MGRHKIIEDDELLARAREIFTREGDTVSTRELARQLGVSSAVLFQRFGSKEELFFAAMTPPMPDMEGLLGIERHDDDECAKLERVAIGLVEYAREFVPMLLALGAHPSFSYEAFKQRYPDAPMERVIGRLMSVFEGKRQDGKISCPNVGPVVLNLVAIASSLAMYERFGVHDGRFSDNEIRELARVLWHGIDPVRRDEPQER